MDLHLFEHTGELVRAMKPGEAEGAELRLRAHRRGLKVWFDTVKPGRFHYEAQMLPSRLVTDHELGDDEVALEVGFHAEHGDDRHNAAVLDRLTAAESRWRTVLGPRAEAGPFLGNENWGRLSEIWVEGELDDPDLAFELASRLVDYIEIVEPLLAPDPADRSTG